MITNNETKLTADGIQSVSVPLMDRRQFAQHCGLTLETVEAMVCRGYLPVYKVGRRSLINIALLNQRCLEQQF